MPLSSICKRAGAVPDGHRLGQRAAVTDAQILDRPQRRARRAPDVVGPRLQAVELLDDDERDDDVDVVERGDARRVGDEDGGVEHDPGAARRAALTPDRHRRPPTGDRSPPLLVS